MKFLSNSKFNKWCCFCKHWYNPLDEGLTPKSNGYMFDVDSSVICPCEKRRLKTPATSTCPNFDRKY